MKNLFNRKDPQVIGDASTMSEEEFLEAYEGKTTDVVLKAVWKENQKKASKSAAKTAKMTAESEDLPGVETVSEYTAEDGDVVKTKKLGKRTIVEIESNTDVTGEDTETEEEEGKAKGKKKSAAKKADKKEKKENPGGKTRAERLRELIKGKKSKSAAKEILESEGYECGSSYHSEWNRLNK